jgi:hypothetical protein
MCFSCSCLAIGKYSAIVSIQEVESVGVYISEHIVLCSILIYDDVVVGLYVVATPFVVNHDFFGSLVCNTHPFCLKFMK